MAYTVHGRIGDQPATITYDNGRLTGTDPALARVRQVLDSRDTVRLTPQDDDRPASPGDPDAVLAAIQESLDEITDIEGDYPMPGPDQSAG